jgi:hypothetical protein
VKALPDVLAERASRLSARVIADMYRNPFWEERFGARGRKFADEDGQHHVSYLSAALAAGDPGVLSRYATWLRTVLVSRGMCTRHLADNYERLAIAIGDEVADGKENAIAYLRAAVVALAYPSGPEAALQAPELPAKVAARLQASHHEWSAATLARSGDDFAHHVSYLLSYLADAVAAARPELFIGHVTFIGGFLERRGVPRRRLDEGLAAIVDELSGATRAAAAPLVTAARAALIKEERA